MAAAFPTNPEYAEIIKSCKDKKLINALLDGNWLYLYFDDGSKVLIRAQRDNRGCALLTISKEG